MAKKDRLIKSKSIYTIKKKHAVTNNGTIYENDHITIIPNDGIYDDEMALFSESNFKYLIRTEKNEKKRHVRSQFIKPEGSSGETWTLKELGNIKSVSEESKIVNKPNYSSLRDFAYYGSATELIKATVNDIIQRFPGGISYYDNPISIKTADGASYYLVSNEFEIDCWTGGGAIASGDVKNPMRVLAASYMNYVNANGEALTEPPTFKSASTCPNSIIGTVSFAGKTLSVYMNAEGKKFLVTKSNGSGGIIKPKQEFIDAFWNTLDDFERVLLNRNTTPVYKAVFETPYTNETGYYYKNKSYTWPTVNNDGFTPDLTTGAFQGYLESLISLAEFHDSYDSDNIWRMMTHESIKNLDWTFVSEQDNEDIDMSEFDTKGIGAMIRIYGRQFDDIKRYADNIKATNSLSYDEKNNVPDYFLSDIAEIDGWEAENTTPFNEIRADVISDTYKIDGKDVSVTTYTSGKTSDFVNSAFLRRMALNSDYIQSLKGTRRGIETILNMFGYEVDNGSGSAGTFSITEHVALVSSALSYDEAYFIRSFGGEYLNADENTNFMKGYPVAVVETKNMSYLIPWFDKNEDYVYPFYFQSKGGWGKIASKEINVSSALTSATTLEPNFSMYGETQPYMRYANNIDDMLSFTYSNLTNDMVCYVTDISTLEKQYGFKGNEKEILINNGEASHYFILKNKDLSVYCGYVNNDLYSCYGWKNVPISEINDVEGDGARVIYLETLIAEYKGNNPHVGFGQYDDGEEYVGRYQNLYENAFKDGAFDYMQNSEKPINPKILECETEQDLYKKISTYGFDFGGNTMVVDNKKCAYFKDYSEEDKCVCIGDEDSAITWNAPSGLTFNPEEIEKGEETIFDESQANGIVNVKNITINFNIKGNSFLKKYIQDVVLKYLEPMIPSTAILEYKFDGGSSVATTSIPLSTGTFKKITTAHAYISGDNETDDSQTIIWREIDLTNE